MQLYEQTYRGFPSHIRLDTVYEQIIQSYYEDVENCHKKRKDAAHLEGLVFVRLEHEVFEEDTIGILFAESTALFKNNRGKYIYIKIGEILLIDGFWKAFTDIRISAIRDNDFEEL